jgi:hypothetical protein
MLRTLRGAGDYITKLPKAEHTVAEWQAAMEALILVANLGEPTMFARIGIMRALNRHQERVFNPDRKDHRCAEARRIVAAWSPDTGAFSCGAPRNHCRANRVFSS